MDWALLISLVAASMVLLGIGIGLYFYTYSTAKRINKQLSQPNRVAMTSPEDGYQLAEDLSRTYAKWVEPHAVAANLAFGAYRYTDSRLHAEKACTLLTELSPWVTCYYEGQLCADPKNSPMLSPEQYCESLVRWMHDTAIRASVLEKYEEYDYREALKRIDRFSTEDQGYLQVADAWRAHFHLLLGEDHRAEEYLRLAEKSNPQGAQHIAIRGHWYLIHGDAKGVIECYRRHNNRDSLNQDFKHIERAFGIKPPRWQ
jgi:hypothetical protein